MKRTIDTQLPEQIDIEKKQDTGKNNKNLEKGSSEKNLQEGEEI